ncbi:MAG: glycogen synthase [Candidatus Wallbacteria bacterium]|nr:glycogen synthase [Candidatus Wallbacteria bacterium]
MKVSMITREWPPHVYGGAGVHIEYLTGELKKLMDVDVRCFGQQRQTEKSLTVKGYDMWKVLNNEANPKLNMPLQTLSTDLAIVADNMDSDIVHTHTWYASFGGFLAKMLYNIPLVTTTHSLEPHRPWKEEQIGTGYHLSSWVEKINLENADKVIAVSDEMKADVLSLFNVKEENIAVIHNGIDPSEWKPVSQDETRPWIRERFGVTGDYIMFVGRITRQKGIDVLIEATKQLPPGVKLVMRAGSPDTPEIKAEMEEWVKGRENIVWIKDKLSNDELIRLYNCAILFACPSVYEPFGIINLEAMACNTAVVATTVGGIKEVVVPGETGLLVPPSDPKALIEAINSLIADRDKAKRFGLAGRARVLEKFTWERIALKTKNCYGEVIEKYKKQHGCCTGKDKNCCAE